MVSLGSLFNRPNPEWFRKPPSMLEKTLRLSHAVRFALLHILLLRILGLMLLFGGTAYLLIGSSFISIIIGVVGYFIYELHFQDKWVKYTLIPNHDETIFNVRANQSLITKDTTKELLIRTEQTAKYSAYTLIRFGYTGLYAWGWEILLRKLYPFFVKDLTIPYTDLLVGFSTKTTESNIALWEVANSVSHDQEDQLSLYLQKYGSRVEDADLRYPTFRENTSAVKSLLTLYAKIPSPTMRLKELESKRKDAYTKVIKNLKVPKKVFDHFLSHTQVAVVLREERRFYEFEFDYYIRQMLLELAKRLNIQEDLLFDYSWKDLVKRAKNN